MNNFERIIANIPIEKRPRVIFLENKPGEGMAVISDLQKLDEGMLILTKRKEKTGPFVIFQSATERKFPIVSLRRPPELCGIDEPELNQEEQEKWLRSYTKIFCASLQQACKKGGIKNLYLAASSSWKQSPYAKLLRSVSIKNVMEDIIY